MSYVKSLRTHLEEKNRHLFSKLELIEDEAKTIMTYTVSKFPYYTPHNFLHSINVEEILNWLVPDEIKPDMSDYELFFLIVASWMHDWGMVGATNEDAEEIRENHHVRTEEFFEKLHDKVHLTLQEARIVGRICRGHRKDDLFSSLYENFFLGSNILIRVRFLAALLRVADACDTTANRTPEIIYYSIKPEGSSDEEFQKHLSISGIGKPNPYKLVLSGVAKTPQGVKVIEEVKNKIQNKLNSAKSILGNYSVMLDTVDAQIDTRGFINKPIEFHLDTESIVKLLIGNELYSRTDVAIREILSNSIDICRLQKILNDSYNPSIEIIIDKDYVTFEDNGIGMDFQDAYDFFSNKGLSFYTSENLKDLLVDKDFDPISKFGIGLLSSFMIGNKMVVETKKHECDPCKFIISELSEGWIYEEGSRKETGTRITLFLNNIGKDIDVEAAIQHYVKKIDIPIFITNNDTGERKKFVQNWNYNIPEIIEKLSKDEKDIMLKNEPKIIMHTTGSELDVTYYFFEERLFYLEKKCFLLKNGIYVGDFNFFPNNVSGKWIALINCKANIIDLKISKEDVIRNKKYINFLNLLYDTHIDAVIKEINTETGSDVNLDYLVRLSSFFMDMFSDGLGVIKKSDESLWITKYFKKTIYPVTVKNSLKYMDFNKIISNGFKKILHYKIPRINYAEHIETVNKLFFSDMNENEAVIFDFGPHFLFYETDPRNFMCAFCETLRLNEIDNIECSSISKKFSEYIFNKEQTPIDDLLYGESYFAKMPEIIKGLTINTKLFTFNPPILTSSEILYFLRYVDLVEYYLFNEYTDLRKNAEIQILSRFDEINKLVSRGIFVYDRTDPFLDFIISKEKTIQMNEPVKNLVKKYFKVLAINSLSRISKMSIIRHFTTEFNVKLLERTIADILGYSDEYVPIDERMSKLARVFFIEV